MNGYPGKQTAADRGRERERDGDRRDRSRSRDREHFSTGRSISQERRAARISRRENENRYRSCLIERDTVSENVSRIDARLRALNEEISRAIAELKGNRATAQYASANAALPRLNEQKVELERNLASANIELRRVEHNLSVLGQRIEGGKSRRRYTSKKNKRSSRRKRRN
jgi:predicted  nucleic acid-binding Zn-ribbon protein